MTEEAQPEMPGEPDPAIAEKADDQEPGAIAGSELQRTALGLLGAASGGVAGILISGWIGVGRQPNQGVSIWWMPGLMAAMALSLAWIARRDRTPGGPAPRSVAGVVLASSAALIAEGVFLFQSFYINGARASHQPARLPLPIWPVSRIALIVSTAVGLLGIVLAVLGAAETSREGNRGAGRWLSLAFVAAAAWAGLALICYTMGYGFGFGG